MARIPTREQVSAGGVVVRDHEVALIRVGDERWQLPKGRIEAGESPAEAARREVREETGLAAETLAPLDTVEYWYVGRERGTRLRFHKFVHFYLCSYLSGDVTDHDQEVSEARWVPIEEAEEMLSFAGEKAVLRLAREKVAEG
ncbi:MAG TPA: NUDIX hydrolase [Trueperaceae bacterium]